MGNLSLFDAHAHLNWFEDPEEAAARSQELGVSALCCTVSPGEYKQARALLSKCPNVRVAAGLHPWFVDETTDADDASEAIGGSAWVGEVGLDFGVKHAYAKKDQLRVFEAICEACSDGGKTLSLHSVTPELSWTFWRRLAPSTPAAAFFIGSQAPQRSLRGLKRRGAGSRSASVCS